MLALLQGSCFSFASTVTTPLFGALTDHMSRPAVMVLAGVIYGAYDHPAPFNIHADLLRSAFSAIGTLGCALSDSMWTLLAARAGASTFLIAELNEHSLIFQPLAQSLALEEQASSRSPRSSPPT